MKTVINIICCCVPLPSWRRALRKNMMWALEDYQNNPDRILSKLDSRPIVLWIDHALGGGTEVYSKRQFKKMRRKFNVLRLQYFPKTELMHLTMAKNRHRCFKTYHIDVMFDLLCQINISEIVVNNLVAYKNTLNMLQTIELLRQENTGHPRVSFRGHDFQSLCPSFNLIDCDGKYCGLKYCAGCENCWARKKMAENPITDKVLKSGAQSVQDWRRAWKYFFDNIVDEVVLFSDAIAKIFTSAYPSIANKIKIIPHDVQKYRNVKIKKHHDINIAVLGNMSYQKGAGIICDMAKNMPDNVNLIIVGDMKNAPENIHVHGKYKTRKLPKIMEKYNVDLVLIPSVWPETFSYTTSEAISMGLPVACFDMGAPAERVAQYTRGLVLNEINPDKNLMQIIDFIQNLKRTNE